MTPKQTESAQAMLATMKNYYAQPSPPKHILDAYFPNSESIPDEFRPLYLLVAMLDKMTGKGFWLDYPQDNPAHKIIAALKSFGKLSSNIEHKLLVLAQGRAFKGVA